LSFKPVDGTFLSDADGFVLASGAVNGCVTVTPPNVPSSVDIAAAVPCGSAAAVPEPATFGLLATGFAMLARRRRKPQA
jgi:PEP-CTERM motif-containing protein